MADMQASAPSDGPRRGAAPRFHELDALRAFAMLLGIVLHAAIFLIPGFWPEEYTDNVYDAASSDSDIYFILFSAIHGFRMQVFFLISGFFTAMLWQRRGLRDLVMQRSKRIGLPLALGALTIIPINTWIFAGSEFKFEWWPFLWLSIGFAHLWFLWFLLWLVAGFAAAVKLGLQFRHPVIWWLVIPLALLPQLLMREQVFGPDTSQMLFLNPVVLAYYALFFTFGAFSYRRGVVVSRWWGLAILPALTVVFLPSLALLYDAEASWSEPVAAALQVVFAWMMCFGLIGLFRWVASHERFWVRYVSDASYWLYLWHLPVIVLLLRIMNDWAIGVHIKFLLTCGMTTAILLVVYQLGVRYTPIGTMLNGKRTRRPAAMSAPAGAAP